MFFYQHPIKHGVPHHMLARQMFFFVATTETVEVSRKSDLPTYIIHGFFRLSKVNLQSLSGISDYP